jgi:hypothetical protein
MSTKENGVSPVEANVETETNSYTEVAQARLQELRLMRDAIPHFRTPAIPNETQRLSVAAAVPPEFIELTVVAVANERALVREAAATPAEVRDFMKYGEAFTPLADELEALAQFIRFSVAVARSKAARQALTTYALAQRLAKQPETAHLAPYVADMRRALGRVRPQSPEALARKAAKKAEKEAAKAAKAAAKVTVQTS